MNPGQEKFYNFILDRVQEENQEKAKDLLNESFEKQANGTFNKEYLQDFMPKLIVLLKAEYVDEVKGIMREFGSKNV